MQRETRARLLASPVFKVIRWTVPWVALAVLVYVLAGYWVDFRRYRPPADGLSSLTSGTVDTTPSASTTSAPLPSKGSVAVTLLQLRLRAQPVATGQVIASLGKGTKLTVLESKKDWLRVKDPLGRVGWVTSSPNFVQLQKQ